MTRTGLRVGVVTAYPPSMGSLNEFGHHLVTHFAANPAISELVVLADEVAEPESPSSWPARATVRRCWRFNSVLNPLRIALAARRSRVDAVYFTIQFASFGDSRIPGGLGLLTPALLRALGVPTIVILHNLADNVDMRDAGYAGSPLAARLMTAAGRLLTRALLAANLVAVTVPRYVEQLQRDYDATNVLLAPHGSFTDLAEPTFDVPAGPRRIMAFGKWGTYKTVDPLVGAFRQLQERGYDDVELVIAGSDSPNSAGYMAGVASRYADVENLVLTGYVAEADVAPLFLSSTVVAFPYSSTTGSSGVLHQAGEYGRAVALPRIGDLLEIIEEEGFRGVYFDAGDATSLADALAKVLDDDTLRIDLGRRNFAAAAGIPMSEVVDWHLIHLRGLLGQGKP